MKNLLLALSIFSTISIYATEVHIPSDDNNFDFENVVKLFGDLTVELDEHIIKGINSALIKDNKDLLDITLKFLSKSNRAKYDAIINKLKEEILCKAILYQSKNIIKFIIKNEEVLDLKNLESPRCLYLPIILSSLIRDQKITKILILGGANFGKTEISKNLEKIGVTSTEIKEICEFIQNCVFEL